MNGKVGRVKRHKNRGANDRIEIDLTKSKPSKAVLGLVKRRFGSAKKEDIPDFVEPMMATLIKESFDNENWEFEIKWDGYRCLAYLNNGKVDLRSRTGQSYNIYTPVVSALKEWNMPAVLDGELVVLNKDGTSNFELLQNWNVHSKEHLAFMVFDILWLDGIDLSGQPLTERKEVLKTILPSSSNIIRFSSSIDGNGTGFFELARENGIEGIVGKKKDSIYEEGRRSRNWVKIKTSNRQEFVIGGWTESDKSRSFKSIVFGYYEGDQLIYFGHAGHGFKETAMPVLLKRLRSLEIPDTPFANETDRAEKVHWMKPELVAEIDFATTTEAGKIRHPAIFLGLREDKKPKEVKREFPLASEKAQLAKATGRGDMATKAETSEDSNWAEIEGQKVTSSAIKKYGGHEVVLINPGKVLWKEPTITKEDLHNYYHSVYRYMRAHLKDRPLSIHIKHIAPTAKGLYIKDMEGRQHEWATIFPVKRKHHKKGKRDVIDYLVCNNEATLQYLVSLGAIDVNPWTSNTHTPEQPDFVIIDLDPTDDDFNKVIESGRAAREFFNRNKIIAFPKTSGKTGLHIYLPCEGFDFTEARTIAENICKEINLMVPSITTTNVTISERGDRLYLDPNQNDFADTVAAPYSVRPHKFPGISTPLEWKEIKEGLDPSSFTFEKVLARLRSKGDLFKGALSPSNRRTNTKKLIGFL
jgi:bifunctional non-homologous end joining protein LigD